MSGTPRWGPVRQAPGGRSSASRSPSPTREVELRRQQQKLADESFAGSSALPKMQSLLLEADDDELQEKMPRDD